MTFVETFEPTHLWRHFDRILTVPRGSKDEARIRQVIIDLAAARGLAYQVDTAGNLVVRKPASAGNEHCQSTILQSHLDMVQEKNSDVDHDFANDPIRPQLDGEYLKASGTTLGSDNGIGVAAMLAVMEAEDLVHGPLELLFTIDEETGLTGAKNLDASMLQGRQLINLDSEDEGTLCVGCAGGADSEIGLPLEFEATPGETAGLRVHIHSMQGGHSGIDIHLQRGNATQLLARSLYSASLVAPFHLAALDGGNAHNAIPREAAATIVVSETVRDALVQSLEYELEAVREEFRSVEPDLAFAIEPVDLPERVWNGATGQRVLQLVASLPHGVQMMSNDIPGLVETSTNLATVKVADDSLRIGMSSRSSVATALTSLRQKIRALATLAGGTVEEEPGYPGWKPDLESRLLQVVKQLHARVLGQEPKVEAVHAGLECGLIGEMIPGMDMISFGPQIEYPHSPNERVRIASVASFYGLLTATLQELAEEC